ncbi:MAG: polysaccharide biosynthesis C-terminal domain-containing protein [Bacteroidales bacterium]|nr:polysaccharide biosynthesis C-terminal domain-containing protein [Bacteroidales bacterium]
MASAVIHILVATSLLGMVITALAFFWLNNPDFSALLITLTIFIIPFRLATVYIAGIYLGRENYRFANMMKWSVPLVNLILLLALVVLMGMQVTGAILALLLSGILTFHRRFLQSQIKILIFQWQWDKALISKMIKLGSMYAASLLVMKLIYRIDVLLLERLADLSEVGYYSVAVNVSEQLWQLPLAMGVVIMSRSANTTDKALMNRKVAQLFRLSFMAGVIGAMLLYVIMPYLIPWLYGAGFAPASGMLQTILPGIVLFVAFRILNSHLNGLGKPLYAIYAIVPALLLNIILNFLWIPELGGTGAAMATNVSYAFGTALMILFYLKIAQTTFGALITPRRSDFQPVIQKIKSFRR